MEDIEAPKTDLNKEPWIVFSDRDNNATYNNAGGKVKAKDVAYLDPFLVIGEKGEFLELIKYTPTILKNGKLDYEKAEYYGWIHKSKLLLNQQSVTDIASGKKNKTLVMFSDTISINEPDKYFSKDSLKVYKDLKMESVSASLSPYSVIYRMKQSESPEEMTLISRKPFIKAEEVKDDVLGWVDNSLIRDIGTGLHVNTSTIDQNALEFIVHKNKEIPLTEDMTDINDFLADQYTTIKYNPVSSYSARDSLVAYRTRIVLPVLDVSDNYIFNVNGGQISHKKYRAIAKGLKKINIIFVFEGKEKTISQFPQIVNALQNLQPIFEEGGDPFSYQFGCVMTFDDSNKALRPVGTELNGDYSQVVNFLSEKANKKDKLKPLKLTRTWSGLRKAIDSFDGSRDATNLIVLIGETGYVNENLEPSLANKLLQNNCRILGFQVYAGDDNSYNNFVLDIESMITSYADAMIKTKGEILVSPNQVKRENRFKEVAGSKNGFKLDFPDNSLTQGFILFPQKGETLPMDMLSNNVDSILQQIRLDNNSIITHMSDAFNSVGNNRTKFDSLFIENFGLDSTRIPSKKLISSIGKANPGWYLPSGIVVLNDSVNNAIDYRLMLSELEMNELKEFVNSLSMQEVEYIYQVREKEQKSRKPCNCPEDDLFAEIDRVNTPAVVRDTIIREKQFYTRIMPDGAYANTSKVRKYLYQQYFDKMRYCKLCKERGRILKSMTLADAQQRIIGSPTSNEILNSIRLKDLKSEEIVSDKMLDDLIIYFKEKKKDLDKAEKFESNGQTYYWLDRKDLP